MDTIKMTFQGETREYPVGITFGEIARDFQDRYRDEIMLALINNRPRELFKTADKGGEISFLTMADSEGMRTYRRSVTFLMLYAARKINPDTDIRVMRSMGQGFYCEITKECGVPQDEAQLAKIKEEMQKAVEADLPIHKTSMNNGKAREMFRENGMPDKDRLLKYRRVSKVNIYELDGYYDYYYGFMVGSTGVLKHFDLQLYKEGFMLLFPSMLDTSKVAPLKSLPKIHATLSETNSWSKSLRTATVAGLNEKIASGEMQHLILVQEALMEKKISEIASTIAGDRRIKFIMIAGPSSSGKTTFANRLSVQLSAQGLRPHLISLDDFFVNRDDMIPGPDGKLDFEALEALDLVELNRCMTALLDGEEVSMPTFNFKTGSREYNGNFLRLDEGDVLVIEGIHGLNEKLSPSVSKEQKYKIYISALSQIHIDENNCMSTTDGRLLRRIIRDARTRGTGARDTIARWPSVRAGEENHIFPFQEDADVIFNSALIYELAVLKVYAEPLLWGIPDDCAEYTEAKRLLKLLDYVLPYPSDMINHNSIIREFAGGSCFNV